MKPIASDDWGEPISDGQYPFWNPHHKTAGKYDGQKGDVLLGKMSAIRELVNKFGKKQFLIDFEDARATLRGKEQNSNAFTLVFSQAHARTVTKFVEGNRYRVMYRGPKDVGKPNPMGDFEIRPAKTNTPF